MAAKKKATVAVRTAKGSAVRKKTAEPAKPASVDVTTALDSIARVPLEPVTSPFDEARAAFVSAREQLLALQNKVRRDTVDGQKVSDEDTKRMQAARTAMQQAQGVMDSMMPQNP